MDGCGGVVTFRLRGDLGAVGDFMNELEVFTLAESLGGVESLAGHPASMSHSHLSPQKRLALGISDNLIRLSSGIEDIDDLLTDLQKGLAAVR
jgi:cystathionine gamma-lyase